MFSFSACKKKDPEPEPVSAVSEPEPDPEMDDTTVYNGKTLKQYYDENEDSIGWMKIPGTKTDNIVMLGRKRPMTAERGRRQLLSSS